MLPDLSYQLTLARMREMNDGTRPPRLPQHPVPEPEHKHRLGAAMRRLRHPHRHR